MSKKIFQPTSLSCFLCGVDNPYSMKLKWENNYEKNQIETTVTIPHEYCSFKGTVHGGIVGALLDETASRALMLDNNFDRLMATMKLETVYKKPTPTGVCVKVIGRVIKDSGSRATAEAEMILPDGTISATCSALLVKVPDTIKNGWDEAETASWNQTKPDPELANMQKGALAGV